MFEGKSVVVLSLRWKFLQNWSRSDLKVILSPVKIENAIKIDSKRRKGEWEKERQKVKGIKQGIINNNKLYKTIEKQ